jgi:hypothetical protein
MKRKLFVITAKVQDKTIFVKVNHDKGGFPEWTSTLAWANFFPSASEAIDFKIHFIEHIRHALTEYPVTSIILEDALDSIVVTELSVELSDGFAESVQSVRHKRFVIAGSVKDKMYHLSFDAGRNFEPYWKIDPAIATQFVNLDDAKRVMDAHLSRSKDALLIAFPDALLSDINVGVIQTHDAIVTEVPDDDIPI